MRNGLHTFPNNVKNLPIPKIFDEQQKPFEDLVDIHGCPIKKLYLGKIVLKY
jgi:hypothetical protein